MTQYLYVWGLNDQALPVALVKVENFEEVANGAAVVMEPPKELVENLEVQFIVPEISL